MALKIFNTLSGEKESFVPLTPGQVRMYVCGVTVYDSAHIGHARSFFTFDIIYRYLKFSGFDVEYVRNFTDVDDKIIKKANDEKVSCETITDRYIEEFHRDGESLGWLRPTREPRATEHIAEIIAIIEQLEAKGLAYRVDGDVYYAVSGFAELRQTVAQENRRAGSRRARRSRRAQALAARFRLVEIEQTWRADLGQPLGSGPAGLAYRMLGHEHEVSGPALRYSRRRAGFDFSPP